MAGPSPSASTPSVRTASACSASAVTSRVARERRIELLCFPLRDREADMTKLPGARVRRFLLQRTGGRGRIHFLDGTPTATVFDLASDEYRVLHWIGLPALRDGEGQWFDLAARAADAPAPAPTSKAASAACSAASESRRPTPWRPPPAERAGHPLQLTRPPSVA